MICIYIVGYLVLSLLLGGAARYGAARRVGRSTRRSCQVAQAPCWALTTALSRCGGRPSYSHRTGWKARPARTHTHTHHTRHGISHIRMCIANVSVQVRRRVSEVANLKAAACSDRGWSRGAGWVKRCGEGEGSRLLAGSPLGIVVDSIRAPVQHASMAPECM